MENIIKQLKNAAKETRLSSVEKSAIKSQLLHYIKTHPVGSTPASLRAASSPFSIGNFRNKRTLSFFVIGGVLMGSSALFAAENTVPGDVLYPVKIHINEPVLGAIAVTPQAKATWDVSKAERRLEEMEKLSVSSNVSPEIKAAAEANFNAGTSRVEERIANFEKDNDNEDALVTAGKLADMLRKHENALRERSLNHARFTQEVNATSTEVDNTDSVSFTRESASSSAPLIDKEDTSLINVLENVRGIRGNAEKKQRELKNKYHKDNNQDNVIPEINAAASGTPALLETNTSRDENMDAVDNHENHPRAHDEEFRATPGRGREADRTDKND